MRRTVRGDDSDDGVRAVAGESEVHVEDGGVRLAVRVPAREAAERTCVSRRGGFSFNLKRRHFGAVCCYPGENKIVRRMRTHQALMPTILGGFPRWNSLM